MDNQTKLNIINEFKRSEGDTGSAEVQIALLTGRINQLTEHMAENRHDNSTKKSLLSLIGQRRNMIKYLKKEDSKRYQQLIEKLGLRK